MLWSLALQASAFNEFGMNEKRNNKRTIRLFDSLYEKPGFKNVTSPNQATMLYRVIREGTGAEHPIVDTKTESPSLHIHMEGWAINNWQQRQFGALPFVSTYKPPEKQSEKHTAAAELKRLDSSNVQQKDRAKPLWQVHKDMMLGLSLMVHHMVTGEQARSESRSTWTWTGDMGMGMHMHMDIGMGMGMG